MTDIKPRFKKGVPICGSKCPQLSKSTFEQYDPSTCKLDSSVKLGDVCVPWYQNRVTELEKKLGHAEAREENAQKHRMKIGGENYQLHQDLLKQVDRAIRAEQISKTLQERLDKAERKIEEYEVVLELCGDWTCARAAEDALSSGVRECWETNMGYDAWCPICLGVAIFDPNAKPAEKMRQEKQEEKP